MANIKSAKKRIKVINTKTERNKAIKTKVKTYIKKVEAAIAANDKAAASEALTACISEISKATSKGIFHKNTASRKIARLSKAVNAIAESDIKKRILIKLTRKKEATVRLLFFHHFYYTRLLVS